MRDDEGAAFARCPHCEERPSAGHDLRPLNLEVDGCECCGVFAKICSDIRNHITMQTTSVFVDFGMGEMLVTHLEQSPMSGTEEDAGNNPGTMGCRRSRRAISSSPSSEGRGECSLPGRCLYFSPPARSRILTSTRTSTAIASSSTGHPSARPSSPTSATTSAGPPDTSTAWSASRVPTAAMRTTVVHALAFDYQGAACRATGLSNTIAAVTYRGMLTAEAIDANLPELPAR